MAEELPGAYVKGRRAIKEATQLANILRSVRIDYVTAVRAIKTGVPALRAAGKSSEQIARIVSARRRELGIAYKAVTPANELAAITARNLRIYQDELGPTISWLRNVAQKSWDEIIESASRPSDYGF